MDVHIQKKKKILHFRCVRILMLVAVGLVLLARLRYKSLLSSSALSFSYGLNALQMIFSKYIYIHVTNVFKKFKQWLCDVVSCL